MGTATSRFRAFGIVPLAACGVFTFAACGGEQYRYVESDDGHMFGKIPHDWQVDREGAVNFRLVNIDGGVDFAFTAGDFTSPWRAEFSAGEGDGVPSGMFESQHLDARVRDVFLLSRHIDGMAAQLGAKNLERRSVALGELEGYRVTYTLGEGDDEVRYDEVYLINDRRSGVYIASIDCNTECFESYRDEIDEVLTEFWVEP